MRRVHEGSLSSGSPRRFQSDAAESHVSTPGMASTKEAQNALGAARAERRLAGPNQHRGEGRLYGGHEARRNHLGRRLDRDFVARQPARWQHASARSHHDR